MSFFTSMISSRVSSSNRLKKLDTIMDWDPIHKILFKNLRKDIMPVAGVKPYDSLSMFKSILLQSWHSLSDPELEEALRVRLDFMLFTGFDIENNIPDETTLCRFRNKLVEKGLDAILF